MATKKTKSKKLKLTQIKSAIGYRQRTKDTIRSLGFTKMNQSILKEDNPAIRGMIKSVSHLLRVEEG